MINKNVEKRFNIISWNSQGIIGKTHELQIFMNEHKPDLLLIQESKLNKRQPPNIANYTSLNKPNGIHKGLLIYHKKHLHLAEIATDTKTFECLGVRINNNICVYNIYSSPAIAIDINELDKLLTSNTRTAVIGDYNARHKHWHCERSNVSGNKIYKLVNKQYYNLYYPNNGPTHIPNNGNKPSVLDFAITNQSIITKIETINDLNSDHLPITITVNTKTQNTPENTYTKRTTDWASYRKQLNNTLQIQTRIRDITELNSEVDKLTHSIQKAIEKHTTITKISIHRPPATPEVKNLIKTRNKLRKSYQNTHLKDILIDIKQLNKNITEKIKTQKANLLANKIKKLSVKNNSLWKFTKRLTSNKDDFTIHKLHTPNGITYDEQEKADTIAEQYYENHKITENMSNNNTLITVNTTYRRIQNTQDEPPASSLASPAEIKSILAGLKSGKAPGHDGITNLALKNLPKKAVIQLMYILNACLKLKYFPATWKQAVIIPFPKPGKDKLFASNYRPISLLPTLGKVFEKIILSRLKKVENNKIIIPEQFGFKSKHSTTLQLARITDIATTNYNLKKTTALLTLDLEKAFDTVWHKGLIHKLAINNFPSYLIQIIISFLKNRTFQVKINNNTLSKKFKSMAGVPQGAILSPFLFNIYINDIPKNSNTQLALFADDTAIIAVSSQKTQANKYIQNHIAELEKYYDKWKIKVNADKTKLIYLTHKKDKPGNQISLYNDTIAIENHIKYLGVTLDSKLKYTRHINQIKAACQITLHRLFPILNKKSPLETKTKLMLFKSYIRPKILYACPIYSNTSPTNMNKLQIIQNKNLRVILNKSRRTPIQKLHEWANINTIESEIMKHTKDFFNNKCKKLHKTKHLGTRNRYNTPCKIKHKLLHQKILDGIT